MARAVFGAALLIAADPEVGPGSYLIEELMELTAAISDIDFGVVHSAFQPPEKATTAKPAKIWDFRFSCAVSVRMYEKAGLRPKRAREQVRRLLNAARDHHPDLTTRKTLQSACGRLTDRTIESWVERSSGQPADRTDVAWVNSWHSVASTKSRRLEAGSKELPLTIGESRRRLLTQIERAAYREVAFVISMFAIRSITRHRLG